MRIGLDASYRVDPQPSGIAVYSAQLLDGLAAAHPDDEFLHFYRLKQLRTAPGSHFANVKKRPLLPFGPIGRLPIFHALNQRVDRPLAPRIVSTFHDLFVITAEYSTPDFRTRFTTQAQHAAERSDLVIAISEFTASQVEELLKVERARIRVIPQGVIHPPPANHVRESMILFVGALQARKNVVRLIEAFEMVPEPWRLVLAGAPSGYRGGEVLERVARSRCRKRIEVTGYLSRTTLDSLFARASIFAFPSLAEGFGIPVLEAMAWGVPVVTSAGSALRELAQGAALMVDPFNVEDIGCALLKMASEPDLRARLSKDGKERASGYGWERTVRETFAVYSELRDST